MKAALVAIVLLVGACELLAPGDGDALAIGVWGGKDAGLLVDDSSAHLHIGCTAGDFTAPIAVDALGHFEATGTYHIRLHPVAVGEPHPARVTGRANGSLITLTVTLTDTAVVLGPARLVLGQRPGMVVCPICRAPRAAAAMR